jgi:hypothetical protein
MTGGQDAGRCHSLFEVAGIKKPVIMKASKKKARRLKNLRPLPGR